MKLFNAILTALFIALLFQIIDAAPVRVVLNPLGKKRDTIPQCEGFKILIPTQPYGLLSLGTPIDVQFVQGQSLVNKVVDAELYTGAGLINILWNGPLTFDNDGHATQQITISIPANSDANLNDLFFLKSWGSTEDGPDCTTLSDGFYLTDSSYESS